MGPKSVYQLTSRVPPAVAARRQLVRPRLDLTPMTDASRRRFQRRSSRRQWRRRVNVGGVLTHRGVGTQGFVFGTTVARAVQMAAEAGLTLSVVLPQV